jgi:hypothetical protein
MFVVMSRIFWYYLCRHQVRVGVLFIYSFAIACFRSLSLGAEDFRNLQELDFQDFEKQPVGECGKWPFTILFKYAFSLLYTLATCIHLLPKLSFFRIWVHTWLVMLSHAVMSVIHVFPPLWCWVWLVLSVESVGVPSVMMWGDCGELRCCGLSKVWNGGEGCDLHGLWLVMLESAKYRVLGEDTPG